MNNLSANKFCFSATFLGKKVKVLTTIGLICHVFIQIKLIFPKNWLIINIWQIINQSIVSPFLFFFVFYKQMNFLLLKCSYRIAFNWIDSLNSNLLFWIDTICPIKTFKVRENHKFGISENTKKLIRERDRKGLIYQS